MWVNVLYHIWFIIFVFYDLKLRIRWVVVVNGSDRWCNEKVQVNICCWFFWWICLGIDSYWWLDVCSVDMRSESYDEVSLIIIHQIQESVLILHVPELLLLAPHRVVVQTWWYMHGYNIIALSSWWIIIIVFLKDSFHPIKLLHSRIILVMHVLALWILWVAELVFIVVDWIEADQWHSVGDVDVVVATFEESCLDFCHLVRFSQKIIRSFNILKPCFKQRSVLSILMCRSKCWHVVINVVVVTKSWKDRLIRKTCCHLLNRLFPDAL